MYITMVIHAFHGFKEFSHHVEKLTVATTVAISMGPLAAAKIVQVATKKKFGHYQGEIGPFEGWAELADSTKDDRQRLGFPRNNPLLRTGKLRASFVLAANGMMAGVGSALPQSEAHELGDPIKNLPARPALGPAFAENEKEAFNASTVPLMALLTTGKLPIRRSTLASATNLDKFDIGDAE